MSAHTHRRWLALGASLSLAVTLAACGGGSTAGGSGGGANAKGQSLRIATSSASTIGAELYLAQSLGYAQKYGVKLDIVNAGATGPSQTAAGKFDLAQFGVSAALAPVAQGRKMVSVYGFANSITRGIAVGAQSPIKAGTTEQVLMQLSGKKLVTQGTVSSGYGNSKLVGDWIVAHGGRAPSIVSVDAADGPVSQLISGQADAAVALPDYLAGALASNKVKMIVPNTDPLMTQITGGDFPAVTLFGVSSNLKKKRQAVSGLIAALMDAHAYVGSHSVDEVSQALAKNSAFQGQSVDTIKATFKYDPPFLSPANGQITEAAWTKTLAAVKNWGTGLPLNDSKFSYAQVIDMSFWESANKMRTK